MTEFVNNRPKRSQRSKRIAPWIEASKELRPMEMAVFLGVSQKVLSDWVTQGLRQKADGSFDVMDYIAFEKERAKKGSGIELLDQERIRKTAADATLAEMRIAEAEGRLVERDSIIRPVRAYLTTACKLIQDLPKRLVRRFPVDQRSAVSEMAMEEIKDTISTLSKIGDVVNGKIDE